MKMQRRYWLWLLFICSLGWAQTSDVVTPDWGIAATMGAMGHDPAASGDMRSYPLWVDEPELAHTIDWGARYYPNRELLQSLDYSMVFDLPFYFHLRPLYVHRPAYHIDFKGGDDFAEAHWQSYAEAVLQMGALMGAEANARRFINSAETRLVQWGRHILSLPSLPKRYAVVQFSDARNLRMYAQNSLFHAALEKMGLEMVSLAKGDRWGNSAMTLADLAPLPEDVCLLIIAPLSPITAAELERSYLWQRMGFREGRCVHKLPAVWVFGGMDSVLRFAKFLHQAVTEAAQ
ncbi:iron complex transport system substrate-binding protein [Mesocricetibacter intestinalis]|uniref:Iron complex transport system substrate-binding protein n=1 Tax=Mesocricetibacter intestinalis TaxID=1521930 RepID=A0A4R6V664_9PAST|nr:iron ABC transporter substrate-binding protein [Mesocricetibacter intestinalis]TDQ56318.1 iron complex transport system substrate-binding protein [Mesocricetibacter intestinalis]